MSDSVDPVDRLFLPPTHGRVAQLLHTEKDKQRKSNKDPEEQFEEELEKKKRHGKVDNVEIAAVPPAPTDSEKPAGENDGDKHAEDEPPPRPSHVDVKA